MRNRALAERKDRRVRRTYVDLLLALNEIKMMMPHTWRLLFDRRAIRGLRAKPSFDTVGCRFDTYQRRFNEAEGRNPITKCASYSSVGQYISLTIVGNDVRMTIEITQRVAEGGARLEYDIRVTRGDLKTGHIDPEWLERHHSLGWAYDTDPTH